MNLSLKKAADLSVCLSFMNKTIILAGNGQLPCHVVEELKIRNLDFVIIGFENNEISLKLKKYKYQIINFGKIITKLKHLKKKGYENIIMVGGLKRPKVFEIKPDFNSLKILPLFAKKIIEGGDNNLLSFAINKMLEMGFNILDIKKLLPDCFLGKGVFTKTSPSKNMIKDINKGQMILNQISKFDIGQSIIIQQGTVVGIEGVQGTDVLIQQSKK